MSRIVVTAGARFIGSDVAGALIARGHDVHVLEILKNLPASRQLG